MTTFAPVPETKNTRILIILHLAVFLAGWTGIFGRLISLGGLPLVWYRMMVSVVVLASVLALMRRLHNPGWKGFSKIAGCGIILALHWVAFFASIQASNVSIGVACVATSCFFTTLFHPLINRKRVSWIEVLISFISIAGVLLIFSLDVRFRLGIALGLLCAALYSVFSILNINVAREPLLSAQLSGGIILGSLGKYTAVILLGNVVQFFVVLPLFLLARGINPLRVFRAMSPAVVMALFTKSSAATLPVTLSSAENRLGVDPKVSRFVLPICTTINMNGCAAFILVSSLFVMQNGGISLGIGTMLLWVVISVFAAVGNAGVPMGCFFLTVSLMTGIGAPVHVMGLILPIYTIIDMVETAENVWSDSCVCAMTDKDLRLTAD